MINFFRNYKDLAYEVKLVINLFILTVMLSVTTFFIIEQLATIKLPTELLKAKRVYILKSNSTMGVYKNFGLNEKSFSDRVDTLRDMLIEIGFSAFIIDDTQIQQIPEGAVLFLADTIGLENYTIAQVVDFVKKGGRLLFNFKSGFNSIGKRDYKTDYLTSILADFEYIEDYKYDANEKKIANYKLISPLINLNYNQEIGLAIYDAIPVFKYPYWSKPSLIATKVGENRPLSLKAEDNTNPIQNAGLLWNGSYFDGKWVYFNFPASTLVDSIGYKNEIMALLKGMLNYLFDDIVIKPYPLFDKESAIFLSGTFKYQYETIKDISTLVRGYRVPFTAFLSSTEVQKNLPLTTEIMKNQYLEVASMGYLSEKITGKSYDYIQKEIKDSKELLKRVNEEYDVAGFYPPKKEYNQPMLEQLQFNNYKYIVDFDLKSYTPYFKHNYYILSMPVNATNDVEYLANPDITTEDIVENMKSDIEFINYLNGLYSLNIQSHIMAYKDNIKLLNNFFTYLKNKKDEQLLFGKEVYDKVNKARNIKMSFKISAKNFIINIENKNDVDIKDFKFRLYVNPNIKITNVATATGADRGVFVKIDNMEYEVMINRLRKSSESDYLISYERENK